MSRRLRRTAPDGYVKVAVAGFFPVKLYEQSIATLSRIGIRDYQLTPAVARRLAHEVMIASVGSRFRVANMQVWLTAAMRCAAAHRRGGAKA